MSMLSLVEARARILARARPLDAARIPIEAAVGRVLAESIQAQRALPGFDNSAMDGYAVRASEATAGATLPVVGELPAGAQADGALPEGAVMRIFTGAPLPAGADTVVMQENTQRDGDRVRMTQSTERGRHVRRAGSDVARGAQVIGAGRVLQVGDVALAGALGRSRVDVVRAPIVAILSAGDELIPVDAGAPRRGQVVASNAVALAAAVRAAGGEPRVMPILPDHADVIRAAVSAAVGSADVVISAGGMSVGDYDFMLAAIRDVCGGGFEFWKVAVKPGKPFAFGMAGSTAVFGLPGNPVSALVTFELLVRPALLAMQGHARVLRRLRPAILETPAPKGGGRETWARATVRRVDGQLRVDVRANQSSGALSSIGGVDALVQIPVGAASAPAGSTALILLLGPDHPIDRDPVTDSLPPATGT